MRRVSIFDSTLRDGAQGSGVTFSVEDKLKIVKILDQLGVECIEAGNPGSNPGDLEFFQRAHKSLCGMRGWSLSAAPAGKADGGRMMKISGLWCGGDGFLYSFRKVLAVSRGLCVGDNGRRENLRMIRESCRYLKAHGKEVIFDAEHYFDGYKDDADFALRMAEAAVAGGAGMICLCDTNGGVFPEEAAEIVARDGFPAFCASCHAFSR